MRGQVLHPMLGTEESETRRGNVIYIGDEMIMRFPIAIRPCPFESANLEATCCVVAKSNNILIAGCWWSYEIIKTVRYTCGATIVEA
jgi:hypothetical protein